jgi:hypothetical protein
VPVIPPTALAALGTIEPVTTAAVGSVKSVPDADCGEGLTVKLPEPPAVTIVPAATPAPATVWPMATAPIWVLATVRVDPEIEPLITATLGAAVKVPEIGPCVGLFV